MSFDYDLFVIGGGSGGVRAARIAAGTHGAKVALAEEFRMGGTCVIRGCVPKKLMVYASSYPGMVAEAQAYGWDANIGGFDWSAFRDKLEAELTRLEAAYRSGLSNAGVTVFDSRAVLVDAHMVKLADGKTISAKHILVATGGTPFVPDIPGSELAITSNEIFNVEALPKRVLIVGGGYIASEFACILNGLGCEVAQFYRGAQILRGFDDEARGHVAEAMRDNGVNIHCGTDVMRLEKAEDGIRAVATDGSEKVFDAVLYATGRIPNSKGLGLEDLGVKLGRGGQIEVDDYSQTAVPSIFAVGDVTDRINLTPVAIREGHAFADTIFGGQRRCVDHSLFASAIFTQPEMGTIGMTEEAARAQEPIEVYATAFRPMQSAFAGAPDRVLMKLIVSQENRKILGCHIVAPGAGEMIQLVGIAMTMGATKEQFDATIAVHPTMSEELVTMRSPVRTG
ncbi:glutathione-disulfide reductase [Pseudorhodobacter turbinis]|uniref:Glutathione reductase n=1 Tax=Pseudorhodobacter turbinis TaxID=2500533 RepID=A0A4P8EEG4_9RHOB|nr:glutathione-disulfide reductase [Pseudorhodobacter turbinis]QCO55137.1 glutathione-disulfide reductase [Pseudorhodobacter turbinis]